MSEFGEAAPGCRSEKTSSVPPLDLTENEDVQTPEIGEPEPDSNSAEEAQTDNRDRLTTHPQPVPTPGSSENP